MDGALTTLLSSGIDAFTNLWDVILTFPTNVSPLLLTTNENSGAYSVRAVGFTPPELTATTYTVDYKTIQLTRPNAKFEGDRTFTLEFRLDANYSIYYDLMNWKHIFFDPTGESNMEFGALAGSTVTNDSSNYGRIDVFGYDSSTSLDQFSDATAANTIVGWNFLDVVCMKVGTPNFQRQNSDALTTTATFIFGRYYEPGVDQTLQHTVGPGSLVPPKVGFK